MELNRISEDQLEAFSTVERVCSVFSLLGCVFIIVTFCVSRAFHKPINRLVFYASFGNLVTNVATLMARAYVGDTNSAGCQIQAFLIQMFMPADAFWTLAMAVNVYLTFYFKFDAPRLRRMELPYLLLCYGLPFTIAMTYIFVETPEKGRMYGNATLWCWVQSNWDLLRITTFYGPIWVVILVTIFIYFRAGREIYKKHQQLRNFCYTSSHHESEPLPPMDDLFCSSKTTEVHVTSEVAKRDKIDLSLLGRRGSAMAGSEQQQAPMPPSAAYSVTISASTRQQKRESCHDLTLPIQSNVSVPATATMTTTTTTAAARYQQHPSGSNPLRRRAAQEANSAAWSYAKCAILFFTAMLVTWIPSSANRVFSVVNAGEVSIPLEFMSAFVLPLQGFWNACIYMVTSWQACKSLAEDLFQFRLAHHRPSVTELVSMRGDHRDGGGCGGGGGGGNKGGGGGDGDGGSNRGSGGKLAAFQRISDSFTELASKGSSGEKSP